MKEKVPLIQFYVKKDNSIEIMVNEEIYKNEKIFVEVMTQIKSWVDYQIPNMKKTLKRINNKLL